MLLNAGFLLLPTPEEKPIKTMPVDGAVDEAPGRPWVPPKEPTPEKLPESFMR